MDGMTRLREFAATLEPKLRDIAGQIEGEANPAGDVSAHDLLPQEEREAIEWVREHGGIDEIREIWNRRSNLRCRLDKEKAKVERQQRHIEFMQRKCRERQERIRDLDKAIAEMRPRLMPEGMEWMIEVWPRFEDSEPVRIGDEVVDEKAGAIYRVSEIAFSDGYGTCLRYEDPRDSNSYNFIDGLEPGERVKRPAPKVLDADGVEIRVGDEVCGTRDMEPMRVVDTDSRECGFKRIKCEKKGDGFFFYCADELTHKLPVLDADGVEIREGDVLYSIETGDYVIVDSIEPGNPWFVITDGALQHCAKFIHRAPVLAADGKPLHVRETVYEVGGDGTAYVFDGMSDYVDGLAMLHHEDEPYFGTGLHVDQLTHERPFVDTWERLEEDCSKFCIEYCDEHGLLDAVCNAEEGDASTRHCTDCGDSCEERMARDLVRRARALAERGER